MFSDSHTHLASHPADKMPELMERAIKDGMVVLTAWGEDLDSSETCIGYAEKYREVYAGVGIHPWNAVVLTDEIKKRQDELARRKKVVAIGEIGLDWLKNPNNKDVQKASMSYQVEYALKRGLPVDVHVRDSHDDVMAILRPAVAKGLKGIAHGFTGSVAQRNDFLALDFYISIGVRAFVTNELPQMVEVVKTTPMERLLCETDNGFTPEHPGITGAIAVAEKMAKVRGLTVEAIGMQTTANLKRILKIQ
jgi:TatD DNase family protein